MSAPPNLIAVVGPTAVGKTALAIALAQRFDGEIINADSRQVYTGMDIGTAKPTAAELRSARHHLIDIRSPDAPISLGEYLPMAQDCIASIAARGKLAILCGGTGQYVWALLEGWKVPRVPPDPDFRAHLGAPSRRRRPSAPLGGADGNWTLTAPPPSTRSNPRRIIRALEILNATGRQVEADGQEHEPTIPCARPARFDRRP